MSNTWISIYSYTIPCLVMMNSIFNRFITIPIFKKEYSEKYIQPPQYNMMTYDEERSYYLDDDNEYNNNVKQRNIEIMRCSKCKNKIHNDNVIYLFSDNLFCTSWCRESYIKRSHEFNNTK